MSFIFFVLAHKNIDICTLVFVYSKCCQTKLCFLSLGTFAVACLMVGSAVTKGYNSVAGDATPQTMITGNDSLLNITTPAPSGGDDGSMSDEELNIRLEFAMSVSFMVGIVQV